MRVGAQREDAGLWGRHRRDHGRGRVSWQVGLARQAAAPALGSSVVVNDQRARRSMIEPLPHDPALHDRAAPPRPCAPSRAGRISLIPAGWIRWPPDAASARNRSGETSDLRALARRLHLRPVRGGRPRLRGRLVAAARARVRQHDPGGVGDPDRLLRRHGHRQRAGRQAGRSGRDDRFGCTRCWRSGRASWPWPRRPCSGSVSRSTGAPRRARDRHRAAGPGEFRAGIARPRARRRAARCDAADAHPPSRPRPAGPLSSSFAVLYAANTVGAVLGATVSGFVLIELLGLTGALEVGVAASLTAGVVALADFARPRRRLRSARDVVRPRPTTVPPPRRLRELLARPTSARSRAGRTRRSGIG